MPRREVCTVSGEAVVKYVILIYSNPASRQIWDGMSADERAAGYAAYAALNRDLADSGELVVAEALADTSHATRVAVTEGRTVTSDGPFAEVKEQLAGFFLIECESNERAVQVASRVPEAELGLVEVRPVLDVSGMEM
jgi:hypothetical protein